MGGDEGDHPHSRFILTIFYNSRMSPVLHLGVWFKLNASALVLYIHDHYGRPME